MKSRLLFAASLVFVKGTGTSSTCYTSWATASLLGTTTRTDGKVEVTYAGHPLYYFFPDKQPGDATGQGVHNFGDLWWVLTPSGAAMH
jgi:predicted lipoprotein with Yx(FWY)xxD motif